MAADDSFDDYLADEKLRFAVERAFTVVGEALNKLRSIDPDTASRVPHLADIVAFRNVLVHAYADIDDRVVWAAATLRTPELLAAIDAMMPAHNARDPVALGLPSGPK